MFERFSKSAREVVERAQLEGRTLGRERIDADVMLLGVAGGDSRAAQVLAEHGATVRALRQRAASGGLDSAALAAIGIDLDEIRRRAEASFGPGALERGRRARGGFVPFTPEAKKTLELALREAIAAGDREIGAEHVLLGLLREGGASALLQGAGADPGAVRQALSPAGSRRGRGA
jgi:Clp amino terminal domain, pathogenicity island component